MVTSPELLYEVVSGAGVTVAVVVVSTVVVASGVWTVVVIGVSAVVVCTGAGVGSLAMRTLRAGLVVRVELEDPLKFEPDVVPEVVPDAEPEVVPDIEPEVMPEFVPDIEPEFALKFVPEFVLDDEES